VLDINAGRLWVAVFAREWWHWFAFRNRSGLHGYRFWWHIGPFQARWGRHAGMCATCEEAVPSLRRIRERGS